MRHFDLFSINILEERSSPLGAGTQDAEVVG